MNEQSGNNKPLGILAGGGSLPLYIAEKALKDGRDILIAGLEGAASKDIEKHDHFWIGWGELDKFFSSMKKANVDELVIIGGVRRPNFKAMKFDFGFIRNIPFILKLTNGGDDEVLKNVLGFIEDKGFKVLGAHEIAPELTAEAGLLTKQKPNDSDLRDIEKGIETVVNLGTMDIGQGAVVAKDYVLCVEAAEGTDQMLERAKGLRQWGKKWFGRRFGVFVKCPKPNQELRIDMPTVGPRTIELAFDAGLSGICIAADTVLISEKQATIDLANKHGLFIIAKHITKSQPE